MSTQQQQQQLTKAQKLRRKAHQSYRDYSFRAEVSQAVRDGLRSISGQWMTGRPVTFTAHRATHIQALRVGWVVRVHKGRDYAEVKVLPERVGSRFGEFAHSKYWYRKGPVKGKGKAAGKGKGAVKAKASKKLFSG